MGSPDATLLSWITAEVNQALSGVREQLGRFQANAGDTAMLQGCSDKLHQVSGALRMVGLAGATRFCETLESSFAGLSAAKASEERVGAIERGVLALKEFVEGLERGQPNVPLRLYPVYRELGPLQGKPGLSEKDLFFPELDVPLPEPAEPLPAAQGLPALLQASRAQFQRGLLGFLRGREQGVQDMVQAVENLYRAAPPPPEPRVWWVARAFLQVLASGPDAQWLASSRALCNKIDFQMRDLAAGATPDPEPLLRELLYALATCPRPTPLAKEIRERFHLESLLPAPEQPRQEGAELNTEWLEAALYDLHSRLELLKSSWEKYVSGEQKSPARFRELVASFKSKAGELGNQHLIKMLDAIALVANHLPDPYPAQKQYMVIEMASAFLLVENIIDHFTSPAADLEQQIVLLGGWLLDSAEGKSNGEPPQGLRGDLVQRIGALQLRAQVAREISSNLRHMEQVLDAFARDASRRDTLAGLNAYVHQVQGALQVLGFHRAAEVVTVCENMIAACAAVELEQAAEEMDWIAEGLSSIGFFLEPCLHGRDPNEQAIDLFFQRFSQRIGKSGDAGWADITSKLEPPGGEAEPAPPATEARTGVDPELLAVFLEEAGEVLKNVEQALAQSGGAEGAEALTTIRRGFHTLKGSGRMVGLMDLGEVAWEIEQLMNRWLEQKREASPELVELIADASKSFSAWIEALREARLQGEVQAEHLVERAQRLAADPAPAAGDPSFFDIYVNEAAGHVAALETELAAWRAQPGSEASDAFMRAAHTLASSSATAGYTEVASLAAALEQAVPLTHLVTTPADQALFEQAVARLRAMTSAIATRHPSGEAGEPLSGLKALAERLLARPAALAEPATPPLEVIPVEVAPQNKRVMRDDIDEQLLPVFLEEAEELVPSIGADLREWKANPGDAQVTQSLRRALHTLKGSARMAGAIRLGELAHLMESAIEGAIEAGAYPAELFTELEERMDRLSTDVERMRTPAPAPAPAPAAAVQNEEQERREEAPLRAQAAMLRIQADVLDHLINQAGEVAIGRSRVEAEVRVVKQALAELSESAGRLRSQLREMEIQADSQMQSRLSVLEERGSDYDPLEFDRYTRLQELTRLMAESLNDVAAVQQTLARSLGETDAALLAQARTTREVQQELMRMRAVPFSNLSERLHRIVRQTAREIDRKAELVIEGAEVELDRSVLERIAAPLEHMVRNCLAHGIEAPQTRVAAGKPETGRISLTLRQESNEVAIILSDDGAGIDADRLHRRAVEKGIVAAQQPLTELERLQLVFASGLSTAHGVTELAGRGVGMDVVKNEVSAIGGRIDIATTRGQRTTFTIYLPLTLAVTHAVLVRSAESLFAVPTAMVEQVLRLKGDALANLYSARQAELQGRIYPLHSLSELIGSGADEVQPYNSVLLLRSGIQRTALHVGELIGNQEIVVKNIGPQLARVAWIAGATVLGDGRIVPIVNPVVLAQRVREGRRAPLPAAAPGSEEKPAPLVMVVDDSLTVRKITSRLLEREGYRVLTAKDGLDALEQLRESIPAAMLVDIEMPRMDGFDLARTVRGEARTREVPIIMISSRTAERHRSHAASLGVNAFLGKPYQDSELLEKLAACTGAVLH